MDPELDSKNYKSDVNTYKPKCRNLLQSWINGETYIDLFRELNATKKEYTWTKFSKKYVTVKQRLESRLDMAFISTSLLTYQLKTTLKYHFKEIFSVDESILLLKYIYMLLQFFLQLYKTISILDHDPTELRALKGVSIIHFFCE